MRIRVQNLDNQLGNPDFQHGQVEILEKLFHEFDTQGWGCEAVNAEQGDEIVRPPMLDEAANAGQIGTFVSRYV